MSSIVSGTWRFDPDPAYARRTAELLRSKPDESQWLQLLFAEVDTWYMAALYEATVEKLTVDEIVKMRQHGVTTDFLADIKQIETRYSTDDIIGLRQHGVTVNFLRQIEESGGQYSIDDVIRLRQHGVDGDYIKALNVPGRAPLDADTIIHLRQRGIDAETVRKLREQ